MRTRVGFLVVFIALMCLLGWVGRGWSQKSNGSRKVWEYKVGAAALQGTPSVQDQLNQLGAEGWELVSVEGVRTTIPPSAVYYLKRARE